jgi:acyl dehydratase
VFWGRFSEKEPAKNVKNIQEIADFLKKGTLKPHIYKKYALSETPEALWDLMNRKVIGKAVVVTDAYLALSVEGDDSKDISIIAEPAEQNFKYDDTGRLIVQNVATLKLFEGKTIGTSAWLEVTQAVINQFASATFDFQWIHLDAERAKLESPFGRTVAHGLLSLSMLPQFTYQLLKIEDAKLLVNYGYNKVRFISPVLSGQKIRLKMNLKSADMSSRGHIVTLEQIIEIEGVSKPACIAESVAFIIE